MKKSWLALILILVLLLQVLAYPVKAQVTGCTATVSPTTVGVNATPNLDFTVTNTDPDANALWVRITSPSTNFTVTSGSASGWLVSNTSSQITFTEGELTAGSSQLFRVSVTTGSTAASAASWTVVVSDDEGATVTTCTGNTAVEISDATPDTSPPTISGVSISNVSDGAVTIGWTTNESATSVVDYGTTSSYGSTKSDTSLKTTHSLELTGLSANTTYHYNIKSTDVASNTRENGDSTFVTAKTGTTTTVTTTVTVTPVPTPTPKPVVDTTPPVVVMTTDFETLYTEAPVIVGRATDAKGVVSVEYSIDGGKSYLPVDLGTRAGLASVLFEFVPHALSDGNYEVVVRARDTNKNVGRSRVGTLIIDRLPPRVGGVLVSIGPQILAFDEHATFTTVEGLDQQVTLSAIGGPTSIDIVAGNNQLFSLVKDLDTGLWSGTLSFKDVGTYPLFARTIDGADNLTEEKIATVTVLAQGKILTDNGEPVDGVTMRVYFFDSQSRQFVLWDGAAFGQENPRPALAGVYTLLLPAGKYYLEVDAPLFQRLQSQIFEVEAPQLVTNDFRLEKKKVLTLGPFTLPFLDFSLRQSVVQFVEPVLREGLAFRRLVGAPVPAFSLETEQGVVDNFDLRGERRRLVTLISTWLPQASEQMGHLEVVAGTRVPVSVFFVHEKASQVSIYQKRGGYTLPVVADPDGVLPAALGLYTLPVHLVVNQKGVVERVGVGLKTAEELETLMGKEGVF